MFSSTQAIARPIKCLTGLLAAVVLCIMLACVTTTAYADGPTITVGSAGEVTPGQEFTVPVSIEGNTGFSGMALQINYDSSALELVGFDTSGLLTGALENVEGGSVAYLSLNNLTDNGVLFSVNFKVRDDAAGGNYDISAEPKGGAESNIVDADANNVSMSFAPGTVQIPGGEGSGGTEGGTGGTTEGGTGGGTAEGTTGGTGATTPGSTTPKTVNAVDASGNAIQLDLRGEAGNLEYSLDQGATWEKLPADGIIVTDDGKRISVYGDGDADYYVQDLPEEMVPLADSGQGISPVIWVLIAIIVVAAIVIIAVVVKRRQRNASMDFGQEDKTGAHSR